LVAQVPRDCSLSVVCPCFTGYSNISKAGLITLDQKNYFPKEYTEIHEEQPQNTNSVGNISDYLRNIASANSQFERNHNNVIAAEDEDIPNSISRSDSVSHSQRSYQDYMEEGKSLMEDFHHRLRGQATQMQMNLDRANNHQGEIEEIKEESKGHSRRFPLPMPHISSEGSKASQSNGFHNSNMAQAKSQNEDDSNSKRSNFDNKLYENSNRYGAIEESKMKWSDDKMNNISDIKHSKKDIQTNSRRASIPLVNNIFKIDQNTEFLDEVFPFQDDFSQENAFGNVINFRRNKTDKHDKSEKLPKPIEKDMTLCKSAQNFGCDQEAHRSENVKYQRSNTPNLNNQQVRIYLNCRIRWMCTSDILRAIVINYAKWVSQRC